MGNGSGIRLSYYFFVFTIMFSYLVYSAGCTTDVCFAEQCFRLFQKILVFCPLIFNGELI